MYTIPETLAKVNAFKVVKCATIKDLRRGCPTGFEARGDFSGDEEIDVRGSTSVQACAKLQEILDSEDLED